MLGHCRGRYGACARALTLEDFACTNTRRTTWLRPKGTAAAAAAAVVSGGGGDKQGGGGGEKGGGGGEKGGGGGEKGGGEDEKGGGGGERGGGEDAVILFARGDTEKKLGGGGGGSSERVHGEMDAGASGASLPEDMDIDVEICVSARDVAVANSALVVVEEGGNSILSVASDAMARGGGEEAVVSILCEGHA